MHALNIYAGPRAREHLRCNGLLPEHVRTIPAAAGGPKGLILGRLDRFLFTQWLPQSQQPIDLIGASIGAWRMATACLNDVGTAFTRLEHDYIHQHYATPPGRTMPAPEQVSAEFGAKLLSFYGGRVNEVLHHPRYRLHVVTTRGRHLLKRETGWRPHLGYAGAFLSNSVYRRAMGAWLERVVFSTERHEKAWPFVANDYRTQHFALTDSNFFPALQASCSIPFVLRAVQDIPGAPSGAYWDGGITDYHLHLNYAAAIKQSEQPGIVLYPHFQQAVVPGWLDKGLRWRHRATRYLDDVVLLAPNPDWVRGLPNGKLPDRNDFSHYGENFKRRVQVWKQAVDMSERLVDELQTWLRRPDMSRVQAL
jgi:hypothetical protein